MRGLIPVTELQTGNGLLWANQDQNYLPRLMNYLALEFNQYKWEAVPLHELTVERVSGFDAVVMTPIAKVNSKKILELKAGLKVVNIDATIFMRQLAPKGAVIGRTTGYILASGLKMSQKGDPKDKEIFSYQNLRQVMRDYPTIYWQVLSFEALKEHLNQNSKNVTIGLTPAAYNYEPLLDKQFPTVPVLKLIPKELEEIPTVYEKIMMLTGVLTVVFMTLRVFF